MPLPKIGAMLLRLDRYLLLLIATVALAALFPARGAATAWVDHGVTLAVALLFFLYGARLAPDAIWRGMSHWRLQALIFASTYILFPILGLVVTLLLRGQLAPDVLTGLMFLCLLPSTVQSSIAFTSIAGGDVPAAIGSASLSNLLGILLTPVLAHLLMGAGGQSASAALDSILKVAGQLLVPFFAGHLARPLIAGFVERHKALVFRVDRSSILLLVYTAFSAAVVGGIWHRTNLGDLLVALALGGIMLAIVLGVTLWLSRRFGWAREDEIVWRFCGSKKSLVSGVPLAAAIFPAAQVGMLLLPVMIFHQMQLMVCSVLARRYAAGASAIPAEPR